MSMPSTRERWMRGGGGESPNGPDLGPPRTRLAVTRRPSVHGRERVENLSVARAPIGIREGAGLVKGVRTRAVYDMAALGLTKLLRGFRTRVSCCVVARLPGICPPRRAWCGRATTRKDSIS